MTTTAVQPASGSLLSTGDKSMANAVSGEDFLKLLITELSHQDPLEPMDNAQLLTQLSEIRSMESSMTLTDTLKELVQQSQMASAANLVGKQIEGKDSLGYDVKGVVQSVRIEDGKVMLVVNNADVPFEGVSRILPGTATATQGAV